MNSLNNKEIMKLLNVNRNGLNSIKRRNKLEDRLLKVGFKLVGIKKIGKKIYYDVEEICDSLLLKTSIEFTKENYNIRSSSFPKYYMITYDSCKNNLFKTANQRAIESNTKRQNIDNWDIKLENKGILKDKRYIYYLVNYRKLIKEEISFEQYSDLDFLIKQIKNKVTDYKIFGNGKDPDIWRKKAKVYSGLEKKAILKINECLKNNGNIKNMINYVWETAKDKNEALNKLYYFSVTKVRTYNIDENNDLHKASIALYSKVVK